MSLLVEHGADPDKRDRKGYTPLIHAVQRNDQTAVK